MYFSPICPPTALEKVAMGITGTPWPDAEDEEHQASRQGRHILGDEPDEHRKDQRYGTGCPAQGKEDAQSESSDEGRVLEEAHGEVNQPLHDALLLRRTVTGNGIGMSPAQREARAHRLDDLANGLDDIYAQDYHQQPGCQVEEAGLADEDADVGEEQPHHEEDHGHAQSEGHPDHEALFGGRG